MRQTEMMHRSLVGLVVVFATVAVGTTAIAGETPTLEWQVVSRRAHDAGAYTQGLLIGPAGELYESTGLYGESTLRQVDRQDGDVLRLMDLSADSFGEGLALVGDRLIQLTWREGIANVWDRSSFELLDTFDYEGEGWGLCLDGERLAMSDGSHELTFRDPSTFEIIEIVEVTVAGEPQPLLNELECVGEHIWANVYRSDRIVRIDATNGQVDGVLDLSGIIAPHPADSTSGDVLNGIAWDPASETFLITGKRWPELIEIRVLPDRASGD
jgi:glutamine cyclotransferase